MNHKCWLKNQKILEFCKEVEVAYVCTAVDRIRSFLRISARGSRSMSGLKTAHFGFKQIEPDERRYNSNGTK
jgi:hypothetical protein